MQLAPSATGSVGLEGVSSIGDSFAIEDIPEVYNFKYALSQGHMETSDSDLTIGDVARRAGVPASTLRYWESVGLLAAPERVGGKRRYDPTALKQISLIVLSKRAGFTLAETRIVLSGLSDRTPPPEIWRQLATLKLPEIDQKLSEARAMKGILEEGLRCDCLTLDDCLRQAPLGLPDKLAGVSA